MRLPVGCRNCAGVFCIIGEILCIFSLADAGGRCYNSMVKESVLMQQRKVASDNSMSITADRGVDAVRKNKQIGMRYYALCTDSA